MIFNSIITVDNLVVKRVGLFAVSGFLDGIILTQAHDIDIDCLHSL